MGSVRRRLTTTAAAVGCLVLAAPVIARATAATAPEAAAVPDVKCDPGAHPEHVQGRVTSADVADGYAAAGYRCNTQQVSQFGDVGGYRVQRYVDSAGHVCAFYDSTLLFPTNAVEGSTHNTGVFVLDMSNPAHPVQTDTLRTPAMQSPHESLSLNTARGLLAADLGNPFAYPGFVDIYDVSHDCLHPTLDSSLPIGVLGHEGGFSPDGKTFWVSSAGGGTMTAIDISNPTVPRPLWVQRGINVHGLNVSNDGNTVYEADLGDPSTAGLDIVDVSEIQRRVPNGQGHLISHLSWPNVSLPQTPIPVTIGGHPYLVEVDEFATDGTTGGIPASDAGAHAGAARIIDIANPAHPRVVSDIRLQANLTRNRAGEMGDPGASSSLQGYASHYCAVPRRADPGIVACSFILSGLRVFDIHDPLHPREIAYFNAPVKNSGGNYAMSAPAFDPVHGQIWYTDGNEGFFAVHLTRSALAYWHR
ncbi:MAG TPA: hypothetical protein VFW24_16080 [Acidimicrobiales bacterium]|nr:hypothetical protein [Acidimicrobiales bacterium]